jgi:hypothetical protein
LRGCRHAMREASPRPRSQHSTPRLQCGSHALSQSLCIRPTKRMNTNCSQLLVVPLTTREPPPRTLTQVPFVSFSEHVHLVSRVSLCDSVSFGRTEIINAMSRRMLKRDAAKVRWVRFGADVISNCSRWSRVSVAFAPLYRGIVLVALRTRTVCRRACSRTTPSATAGCCFQMR